MERLPPPHTHTPHPEGDLPGKAPLVPESRCRRLSCRSGVRLRFGRELPGPAPAGCTAVWAAGAETRPPRRVGALPERALRVFASSGIAVLPPERPYTRNRASPGTTQLVCAAPARGKSPSRTVGLIPSPKTAVRILRFPLGFQSRGNVLKFHAIDPAPPWRH